MRRRRRCHRRGRRRSAGVRVRSGGPRLSRRRRARLPERAAARGAAAPVHGLRRADGTLVYPGWPKSSEALTWTADGRPQIGWHRYLGRDGAVACRILAAVAFSDPEWDWWGFDPDRDLSIADARVGAAIDQTSADLHAFAARGGKVIVYHGWQDPVVNALDTIAYYEQVRQRHGSQPVEDFLRLFLVPGMGHCSGGTGTTCFGNQQSPRRSSTRITISSWPSTPGSSRAARPSGSSPRESSTAPPCGPVRSARTRSEPSTRGAAARTTPRASSAGEGRVSAFAWP